MSDVPETKPTLETVVRMLGELRAEMTRRFDSVEAELRSTRRQIGVLSQDIVQLRADVGDALARIEGLEERVK